MAQSKKEVPTTMKPLEVEAKVVHVPVIMTPSIASTPREKIDVVPDFIDFKIALLDEAELVDSLGLVKKARKDLDKWEKLAVDVLKGRMKVSGTAESQGLKYKAVLSQGPRRTLSNEKLLAKFGEAQLDDCYVETPTATLNVGLLE